MFTKADIETYFLAEKSGGLFILVLGLVALLAASFLFFGLKVNFYKGMAVSIALLALVQIISGFSVYQRSDKQRQNIVYAYDMHPGELQQKELPRMQKVSKTFTVLLSSEIILFLVGIAGFVVFKNNDNRQWLAGIGIGLALQMLVLFAFDMVALKRAASYKDGLSSFVTGKGG